jgi:hypothetical protein
MLNAMVFSSFMTDKAGIFLWNARFCVTIRTVIHLHTVPWVFLIPRDILAIYIDAIPGQAILFIRTKPFTLSMIPVTGPACDLPHHDMGDMGKVDAIGLSGIGQPWDLLFIGHISSQEFLFLRVFPHGRLRIIVTFHTFFQFWQSGKGPVIPKGVTVEAGLKLCIPLDDVRVRVQGVAEINGLWLSRIEDPWKENPAYDQGGDKAGEKIGQSTPQGIGDHLRVEGDKKVPEKEEPSFL